MRELWVCTLFCSLLVACDEDVTAAAHDTAALTIALKGSDIRGQSYRLRSAEFELSGCPDQEGIGASGFGGSSTSCSTTTVSGDADLDADFITRRLLPGNYTVTLRGAWYLEEVRAGQPERVDQAVLLSPATQYTYVWNGGSQTIFYSFGVGGDVIDFRHGDLNIGIQVEHPGDRNGCGGGAGVGGSYPCNQGGSVGVAGAGFPSGAAGAFNP